MAAPDRVTNVGPPSFSASLPLAFQGPSKLEIETLQNDSSPPLVRDDPNQRRVPVAPRNRNSNFDTIVIKDIAILVSSLSVLMQDDAKYLTEDVRNSSHLGSSVLPRTMPPCVRPDKRIDEV